MAESLDPATLSTWLVDGHELALLDARELGVFQQNVHRYESGSTPHADFLITLALKENISLDWLLLGKGRMRRTR